MPKSSFVKKISGLSLISWGIGLVVMKLILYQKKRCNQIKLHRISNSYLYYFNNTILRAAL